MNTTIVIEKNGVGGDLFTYGSVKANITTEMIIRAFHSVPRWRRTPLPYLEKYESAECPLLSDVAKQLVDLSQGLLKRAKLYTEEMKKLCRQADGTFTIFTTKAEHIVSKVVICTGAIPKELKLKILKIPLHVALNVDNLPPPSANDKVVVFGTSHSGTLVLKNLKDKGYKGTIAIYRNSPFVYARDGAPNGVKQESEKIADEILANSWGAATPQLIHSDSYSDVFQALQQATAVVYATGFERRPVTFINAEGNIEPLTFNTETSDFGNCANLFGFGIGFPGADTNFQGFITSILAALSRILA